MWKKKGGAKEEDGRGEGEEDDDDSSNIEVKLGGYLTFWAWKIAEARGLWELTDEAKRYQTWWAEREDWSRREEWNIQIQAG